MRQPPTRNYPAALKERAGTLAVAADQPMAQTARALGVPANTLPTWSGPYHRAERQEQEVNNEQLSEERTRLRTANARLQAEHDICKKAAASFAHQRPERPRGWPSRTRRARAGAAASAGQSRTVVMPRG